MMRQPLPGSDQYGVRPKTIPAPVAGWVTARSLADMKQTEAVYLDNMFPRTSDVMLRKGTALRATLPADKRTRGLIGYKDTSGNAKLFAATQSGLYDITAGDASVAATAATNAEWQYINVTTSGGPFAWLCNATDKCKLYNGATWTDLDGASSPALTGITSTDVANVSLFKTRVILTKKNSLSFYYLPVNAIAGAATEFPLGSLFKKGGYLVATDSWTHDGGNGPDDYFVAVTSEGELALYKGTDPSSLSTFALVGVYTLPKPIGRRCFVRFGADLAVLTEAGLLPLSKALNAADQSAIATTRAIDKAFLEYASSYKSRFGWQPVLFPEASMLLINVPFIEYESKGILYSYQLVMNTMTGAWCRFLDLNSEVWLAFNGKLYFALYNKIYEAWTGTSDNGGAIRARGKTAFNPLGSGGLKQITALRPLLSSQDTLSFQIGVDVDYDDSDQSSSNNSYAVSAGTFDSGKWNIAKWGGSSRIQANWSTAACFPGRVAATRLRLAAKDVSMAWIATDLLVKDGGI